MYRVILSSTNNDAVAKLSDKVWDFIESQCNYARQHSFLLHELPTKSFRRTIAGKGYIFKLVKGILTVTCDAEKIGSINLNQGCKVSDATKIAQKVIKHSSKVKS